MTTGESDGPSPRRELETQALPKDFLRKLKPLKNELARDLTCDEATQAFGDAWVLVNGMTEGDKKWTAHIQLADLEMHRQIQRGSFEEARSTYKNALASLVQLEKDADGHDVYYPQTILTKARLIRTSGLVELFDGNSHEALKKLTRAAELFDTDKVVAQAQRHTSKAKSLRHSHINELYIQCAEFLENPEQHSESVHELLTFARHHTNKISVLDRLPVWNTLLDERTQDYLSDTEIAAVRDFRYPPSAKEKLGRGATKLLDLSLFVPKTGIRVAGAALKQVRGPKS